MYIRNLSSFDPMSKLSDGSFNDAYLIGDGVHLTDKVLNKIALKLNLRMNYKDGGCVTDRMQMGANFGDESSLTVPSYRTGQTKNMQSQPNANVQTSSVGWKTVNYHRARGHGLGMRHRPVSYAEVISHTTSSWCYKPITAVKVVTSVVLCIARLLDGFNGLIRHTVLISVFV